MGTTRCIELTGVGDSISGLDGSVNVVERSHFLNRLGDIGRISLVVASLGVGGVACAIEQDNNPPDDIYSLPLDSALYAADMGYIYPHTPDQSENLGSGQDEERLYFDACDWVLNTHNPLPWNDAHHVTVTGLCEQTAYGEQVVPVNMFATLKDVEAGNVAGALESGEEVRVHCYILDLSRTKMLAYVIAKDGRSGFVDVAGIGYGISPSVCGLATAGLAE